MLSHVRDQIDQVDGNSYQPLGDPWRGHQPQLQHARV